MVKKYFQLRKTLVAYKKRTRTEIGSMRKVINGRRERLSKSFRAASEKIQLALEQFQSHDDKNYILASFS